MQMEAQMHNMEMQNKAQMARLDATTELHKQRIFMAAEQNKAQAGAVKNQQDIVHKEQSHQQKLKQTKEVQSLALRDKSSKTGKATK